MEAYAQKVLRELSAQRRGALHIGEASRAAQLKARIGEIQELYLGGPQRKE